MRNPSSTRPVWRIRGRDLSLDRPLILGILNVTPDSFSDGGEHAGLDSALAWARAMRDLGADMIDVGGESTRPGFAENAVPLEEERRRVIPVVRALASEGFLVSVDTSKPEIMLEAAQAGAHVINDIRGFELPGALEAAARTDCGLVLMDRTPLGAEESAVERVLEYLEEREAQFRRLGVEMERICRDPGFGFGKTPEQNFDLLAGTSRFAEDGRAVMAAVSRKSSIGWATGVSEPKRRVPGSCAAALLAVERGAFIVRTHDCGEMRQALDVWTAFRNSENRIKMGGAESSRQRAQLAGEGADKTESLS